MRLVQYGSTIDSYIFDYNIRYLAAIVSKSPKTVEVEHGCKNQRSEAPIQCHDCRTRHILDHRRDPALEGEDDAIAM